MSWHLEQISKRSRLHLIWLPSTGLSRLRDGTSAEAVLRIFLNRGCFRTQAVVGIARSWRVGVNMTQNRREPVLRQSAGRISSSYLAPAVVESERPRVGNGVLNPENPSLLCVGRVLDDVKPEGITLRAGIVELRAG